MIKFSYPDIPPIVDRKIYDYYFQIDRLLRQMGKNISEIDDKLGIVKVTPETVSTPEVEIPRSPIIGYVKLQSGGFVSQGCTLTNAGTGKWTITHPSTASGSGQCFLTSLSGTSAIGASVIVTIFNSTTCQAQVYDSTGAPASLAGNVFICDPYLI